MAKNLSLNFGVPTTLERAEDQHEELANKLKNNEVFSFPFQNRGYLVLEKARGKYSGSYFNILYNYKPQNNSRQIKKTQV